MDNKALLITAIEAALEAGKSIMKIYATDFEVQTKADESPLTMADNAAHEDIMRLLEKTNIPVLSEEGKEIPYDERKNWSKLWIVDPLDGTKEFVKKNDEFTVNIALIVDHYPVLGVIYVPAKGTLYFGAGNEGAWHAENVSDLKNLTWEMLMEKSTSIPKEIEKDIDSIRIVASRSHMSPETEMFIKEQEQQFGKAELVSMGSSLKICLVAEGIADVYPRFAPTMEWDTAAGQAIAEAAGKEFIDYETGERMMYNRENLLNNWFLVS